jgi:hypothetical protein
MPERPKPDLEHTREAMREHDERVESEHEHEPEPDDAEPDQGEEQKDEG